MMPNQLSRRAFLGQTGTMAALAVANPNAWGRPAASPVRPMRLGGPIFLKSQDPAELAQEHRRLGYRAAYAPKVEINDTDRIKAIIKEFAARDVAIAEVGAWRNMLDLDPEKWRQNLAYVQERLALAERKLREQAQEIESHASDARTDALTLLPNRRAFDEELARRIAEADRLDGHLCAVMIDIDHFKHFNDQYGHPAGDEVLQAMGRVLGRAIRQMDLIARYGGDEFAALMPASSFEDAQCGARRIRDVIEDSVVHFEDRTLEVTASIGLAKRLPGEDGVL